MGSTFQGDAVRLKLSTFSETENEVRFSGLLYELDFFGRSIGVWPYRGVLARRHKRCQILVDRRSRPPVK